MGQTQKVTAALLLFAAALPAVDLKPRTVAAFDAYIRQVEARQGHWPDPDPGRLHNGEIVVESVTGPPKSIPDGLIHDWTGAVFIPRTTLEKTLALVKDYDHRKDIYQPEVIDSRKISDHQLYMRVLKKKVITVVLDTWYDVQFESLDPHRAYSRSVSTRIQEVDNPGKPNQRLLPEGEDHGFLWRLNSYWHFSERDGGVYVECEAVSLTRDIPIGLGWLIEPIIRDLPKESLVNTLQKTKQALQ